jgi:hypothetical protein
MYVVQVFDQFTKKCFGCFWLNGLSIFFKKSLNVLGEANSHGGRAQQSRKS